MARKSHYGITAEQVRKLAKRGRTWKFTKAKATKETSKVDAKLEETVQRVTVAAVNSLLAGKGGTQHLSKGEPRERDPFEMLGVRDDGDREQAAVIYERDGIATTIACDDATIEKGSGGSGLGRVLRDAPVRGIPRR